MKLNPGVAKIVDEMEVNDDDGYVAVADKILSRDGSHGCHLGKAAEG